MNPKEIEFLKQRSKEFYENALSLFKEKKYNLAAFNIEQSCQLYLKYLIGKKIGEWPKTHYLDELIEELSDVYERKEILEYFKNKELFFQNLTDAYFTSRYHPKNFTLNLTQQLITNYQNFIKFLEESLGDKFLK